MNKIHEWVNTGLIVLVLALVLVGGQSASFGSSSTTSSTITAAGFTTTGTLSAEQVTSTDDATITDDLTVSGGTLTVTTSNTATSSAIVGCIQMPATSTATQYKLVIANVATTTVTFGYGTAGYAVVAMPGTCQ